MDVKAVDLKPNRDLIDPHFDGYKLTLDHLPVYKVALDIAPDVVNIRNDQYTYQHIKAFALHNYLYADPWNRDLLFYIDETWNIMQHDMSQGPPLHTPTAVYTIPESSELRQQTDRLNVTLHCTSPEWVIISDGTGHFYLLKTGERKQGAAWQVCYKGAPVPNPDPDVNDPTPFSLLHSVLNGESDGVHVETLLLHVEKNLEADNENRAPPYLTKITWITLSSADKEKWEVTRTRQLSGCSSPDYAALDGSGKALFIASQKPFQFVYDSEKPIQKVEKKTMENGAGKLDDDKPSYVWTQTSEDATLVLSLPEGVSKPDILYKLTADAIDVGIKNSSVLIKGSLTGRVDVEGCTWTISQEHEQNKLEVHLEKSDPGPWAEVVVGDRRGHLVADEEQLDEIHQRLAHLTSEKSNPEPEGEEKPYNTQELEDCDRYPDHTTGVTRYDGDTHQVTHQANLGSNQWLFNVQSDSDKPPCFCLRHDVDGLIWQPITASEESSPWSHIATFNAFGYVQASKQQKKFSSCSPDFSYAVICDCVRHVYIYRQPSAISSPLRNRKTGREVSALAKQQVVSLDSVESIMGLHVTNDKVYVMIGKALHMIRVNTETV